MGRTAVEYHRHYNTAIGVRAGENVTGNSNICIGSQVSGVQGESNAIRIGDNLSNGSTCFIGGIAPTVMAGGYGVVVNPNENQLGIMASSARFKKDITSMEQASEAILSLRPVTFHYKTDTKDTPQFGLIAEEVAKVNPALALPDKEGKPFTVRYDAVNAMLLNEFLKEHQKVQRLETALAAMDERLKQQDAKIERVKAKVELSNPAPQTVLNRQ